MDAAIHGFPRACSGIAEDLPMNAIHLAISTRAFFSRSCLARCFLRSGRARRSEMRLGAGSGDANPFTCAP